MPSFYDDNDEFEELSFDDFAATRRIIKTNIAKVQSLAVGKRPIRPTRIIGTHRTSMTLTVTMTIGTTSLTSSYHYEE